MNDAFTYGNGCRVHPAIPGIRWPLRLPPSRHPLPSGPPGGTTVQETTEASVPVHLTSTYGAGGELEYGRYGNPTWTAFEDTLGALEGGRCVAFASGMAAIAAVLDLVEPGGTIVAPRHSYTGTVAALR